MNIDTNKNLHSSILQSLAALREYDKVKYWDDDMQDEVKKILLNLEKSINQERIYYSIYRKITLTYD